MRMTTAINATMITCAAFPALDRPGEAGLRAETGEAADRGLTGREAGFTGWRATGR